jgi:hypothetical protein
MFSVI